MQPNSPTDSELEKLADHLAAQMPADQGDAIDFILAALKSVRDRSAGRIEALTIRGECSGPLPGHNVTVVQTGTKTHFITRPPSS